MAITEDEMRGIVQAQLAIDLNCTVADLNGEKDSLVFVEAKENPGRRPFPRKERYFEIVSMGQSIVISATPERLAIAKQQMQGKDRDTIFSLAFIRGLYLHYLPDLAVMGPLLPPAGFQFELIEDGQVVSLLPNTARFDNAIIYDRNHPYQTGLAVVAKAGGELVAVAGASKTCPRMWQIGVEVLPAYRSFGLATYLVNRLTLRILERGDVPSYDAIASNLASQRVAHRVGYCVAWVSDWRCSFVGLESAGTSK